MKTRDYIDLARKLTPTGSDYAVAKLLGIGENAVNHYRKGRRVMDNRTARKLAEVLKRDLRELIAAAEMERATDPAVRKEWAALFKRARAGAAALASVIVAALQLGAADATMMRNSEPAQWSVSDSKTIETLTIMRQSGRSLWRRLRGWFSSMRSHTTPCALAP